MQAFGMCRSVQVEFPAAVRELSGHALRLAGDGIGDIDQLRAATDDFLQ